jgi:hypothetical protein
MGFASRCVVRPRVGDHVGGGEWTTADQGSRRALVTPGLTEGETVERAVF